MEYGQIGDPLVRYFERLEKDDPETFDEKLRTKLKEKIFMMPEYNTYRLSLYANAFITAS